MTVTGRKTVLDTLPCTLPTEKIPDDIDASAVAASFTPRINDLGLEDFASDAIWRDTFALTGSLRTFYSAGTIVPLWKTLCRRLQAKTFALDVKTASVHRTGPEVCWIDVAFTFETEAEPATSCYGYLSLIPDRDHSGSWKIWLLRTVLEQLQGGHGNVDQLAPLMTDDAVKVNGIAANETNGDGAHHFDCVVVGAGQSGLSTAGRLQALGVSYVLIERNDNVGDNWALRYDSVKLHTTREYAHLAFDRTFTPDYPEWLSSHDLARGYKKWAVKYGINVWLSTSLESGRWDESQQRWILQLRRRRHADGDIMQSVSCSHVVLACGACLTSIIPAYPGKESFKGIVLHSADYTNPFSWKGKHGVVIGTANTAHDVADDMLEAGLASVTMVQRGRTYVLPREVYKRGADTLYNAQIPTSTADRILWCTPLVVGRQLGRLRSRMLAAAEPEQFDGLERAGFRVDRYEEILHHIHDRYGGHYMDVGTSKKIIDGLIKMKSDALPVGYTEDGLQFSDGSTLKADVIVFATGFTGNLRDIVRDIFGAEVADKVEDYWGLNREGELRGAYKPSGHPGLWYMGGTIGQSRYYSRFVALQIKAAVLGSPLPVFDGESNPCLGSE